MTLEEMETYDRDWLTCAQIAQVLGSDPYSIHLQAHSDSKKLGFPVTILHRRVKIPRIPFLMYMKGEKTKRGSAG